MRTTIRSGPAHQHRGLALTIALLAGAAAPAAAGDFVVSNGTEFSIALATSVDGDTITMLPGTYTQIPGWAFAEKTLTIRGSTGDREDVVIDGIDQVIGLQISGAGADGTVIEDLTVRRGRGGTATNASGAGIWISGANVTIRNCIIEDNVVPAADGQGAGVYATQGDIQIEDCIIRDNVTPSATGDGVGLYCNGGNHVIVRTVFQGNGVPDAVALDAGSIGGGFYADGGTARLSSCVFEDNRAGFGGGIGVAGTMTMTIDGCRFISNQARNGAGYHMTVTAGGGTSRIRNTLFSGNSATVNDSAVFTSKPLIITNCTMHGNTSPSYVVGGAPAAGTVTVDNCIVWGNTLNAANGLFPNAMAAVARRNIFQQAYTLGTGTANNRVMDPLFTNAAAGDFTPQGSSPAIDSGDSNLYFGPFSDLAGNPRGVDDPNTPDTGFSLVGPVIDVGAFEFAVAGPGPTCPADFDQNDTVNSSDISAFLVGWIQAVNGGCP